jgi:hypothetical protein
MKAITRQILSGLLIAILPIGGLVAAESKSKEDGQVTVNFSNPEKFTDVKENDTDMDNERGADRFLPQIRRHIQDVAKSRLEPGQKLTVTFTDIDLAGDFEPWRGLQAHDVRIVKAIYVPRMSFNFSLVDESGNELKGGKRDLIDNAFQMRTTIGFRDDPLRYEKEMLSDWLRREFGRRSKS